MKDISKIPKGYYCYDENGHCPYYRVISDRPERLSGFCDFLEKGDLELSQERVKHNWEQIVAGVTSDMSEEDKKVFAESGAMSLLWDECKEDCPVKPNGEFE